MGKTQKQPVATLDAQMRDAAHRGALIDALDLAKQLVTDNLSGEQQADMLDKVYGIRTECQMTYDALTDGQVSKDMNDMFGYMRQRVYGLADALALAIADASPSGPRRLKDIAKRDSDMADIQTLIDDYKQMVMLGSDGFEPVENLCQVLDCQNISEPDAQLIFSAVVNNAELPQFHRAYVVSSLCHNLITRHNRALATELIKTVMTTTEEDPILRGRAAVAIAADMVAWPNRWTDDGELLNALKSLCTDETGGGFIVHHALIYIIRQRLVPIVEHILEVEMQDKMNLLVKRIIDKNPKGGHIKITEDDAESLFGTDGEKVIDGLAKIENWRTQGVDVGFVSMKHMKSFAFFKYSLLNWLRPFDPADAAVANVLASFDDELRDAVAKSIFVMPFFPDSDRYSMIFCMTNFNAETAKEYCRNLPAYMGTDNEAGADGAPVKSIAASLSFVEDLYRAVRLRSDDFGPTDLFANQKEFFTSGLYSHVFFDDMLQGLGRAIVECKAWPEAQELYSILCAKEGASVANIRKYAFCLLKTADTKAALEQLRKADLIDDSDAWTKRMMAECHIELGQYQQAAYVIEQLRAIAPSDARATTLSARCNEQLHKYDLALADWSEVAYTQPDNAEAAVGVARCMLFAGKKDEVADALAKCPEGVETDKVRALLLTAQLKFSEARKLLASIAKTEGDKVAADLITQAVDCLISYGVSRRYVLMMADTVRLDVRGLNA